MKEGISFREPGLSDLKEHKGKRGIGLIIVNRDGNIWTIQEKKPKNGEHNGITKAIRLPKQRSIPLETIKNSDEKIEVSVKGAFAEVCNDKDLELYYDKFYCLGSISNSTINGFFDEDNNVLCQYVVLYFDGDSNVQFSPFDEKEVVNGKWVNPRSLFKKNYREYSKRIAHDFHGKMGFPLYPAIFHIFQEAIIQGGILQYAFSNPFRISEIFNEREKNKDT